MDRLSDGMDYSGDAGVASFFSSDFKRHDDLKQLLDSNRDNLKLDAMKRIIGMVAKGRDASDLFPAVVKNVVSKNTEVKKLVYVYLVRYAEEQQDLALLSISTFQRALKDPNQLIRASALRVLSSIRVPVIVPIVMLAIRESSADMSPYVRKTAAHAIPKLYSLDPEQKEELVQILDKLLADRTTLVVGSAVMAFEEVCPERIDLIHKNYRKLCSLLVDVDEWGQVVILNTLTRYARTQFLDPNIGDLTLDGEEKPFYDEEEKPGKQDADKPDGNENDKEKQHKNIKSKPKVEMDSDHRLLLKNCRPLLQSRSASVVMAVVQLYHHLAPKTEVHAVIKPLIRLLRSHSEVQAVVLTSIAAMSANRKTLFEPYMKNFFVRSSDPLQIKLFKLEILTNIANETNIPPILREFQTYISSQDKEFIAATIEAIGRCASNIKEVAETCLNGLVALLSHRDPAVVGGAVVVAKTLLQTQRSGNKAVISQLAKMVDRVAVPPARAAILWLLGEHSERIPHLPPDVLRKMAKTFPEEEDVVKLQILNLASKLQLTNPTQTTLLCQYVLNLAKYDQSYDIRDRARFLRQLLFPENPNSKLFKYAKRIILSSKPAPILQSRFNDRDHFQLGSLSHYLNSRANGYRDLPVFPSEAPDPTVRNVEPPPSSFTSKIVALDSKSKKQKQKKTFYSDSEKSKGSSDESGSSGTSDSDSDSSSDSEESSSESDSSDEKLQEDTKPKGKPPKPIERKVVRYKEQLKKRGSDTESGSSEEENTSEDTSGDSSETENSTSEVEKKQKESNVDLLLDLDFEETGYQRGNGSGYQGLGTSLLSPTTNPTNGTGNEKPEDALDKIQTASPIYIPRKSTELLNKMSSGGLEIYYRFTRVPHLFSTSMVSVELQLTNTSNQPLTEIRIGQKMLSDGMAVHDFDPISVFEPKKTILVPLGVDFKDRTQGAKFELLWNKEMAPMKQILHLKVPIGELVRPVSMSETLFLVEQGKLRGMTEHETKGMMGEGLVDNLNLLGEKIYEMSNLLRVPSSQDDLVRFSGQLVSSDSLVLVSIHLATSPDQETRFVVNCEKMVVGSLLLQELKEAVK